MPSNRQKRKRKISLGVDVWNFLSDIALPSDGWTWDVFDLEGNRDMRAALWSEHRAAILEEWIQEKPGTRPSLFWEFDVPRQPKKNDGWYFDGTLPVPRKRIKGVVSGGSNPIIHFYKGIPAYEPFDQDDYFESEASYLTRHGLLLPGEADRLKAADFKPQAVSKIIEEKERCRCY